MSLRTSLAVASLIAASTVMTLAAGRQAAAPNTLTDTEKKAGWSLLFDGKSLDGWRGYNESAASNTRWRVENGPRKLPPSAGEDTRGAPDIISKETYEQQRALFELGVGVG